jgi:hypothetical protein
VVEWLSEDESKSLEISPGSTLGTMQYHGSQLKASGSHHHVGLTGSLTSSISFVSDLTIETLEI